VGKFHIEGCDNVIMCVCHKILLGSSNQGGCYVWGVLLHSGLARSAYETLDRKPEWKELRYRGWRSCENNTKTDVIYIYIYIPGVS